jgi:hypothetical protein
MKQMKLSKRDEASIKLVLWLLSDTESYKMYIQNPVVQAWLKEYAEIIAYCNVSGQLRDLRGDK